MELFKTQRDRNNLMRDFNTPLKGKGDKPGKEDDKEDDNRDAANE